MDSLKDFLNKLNECCPTKSNADYMPHKKEILCVGKVGVF